MPDSKYYNRMIVLRDRAVVELSEQIGESETGLRFVERAAAVIRDRLQFDESQPGYSPFCVIMEQSRGNCLSLSCLMCSVLRANGFGVDEVLVLIGGDPGFYRESIHAWTAVRVGSRVMVIDPRGMQPESGKTIDGKTIYLLFNDEKFIAGCPGGIDTVI